MLTWLEYLGERIPLPVYVFLAAGLGLSSLFVGGIDLAGRPFGLVFFGIILVLVTLRVMDDVKDYDKDVIVNPERPLPRGVITVDQTKNGLVMILMIMMFWGMLVGALSSWFAAANYGIVILYLCLMFKKFFLDRRLSDSPFLYALSHQLVIFPVCAFGVAVASPLHMWSVEMFYYGTMIFGAFFAYEVCRKFDPAPHPLMRTYRQVYGLPLTGVMVVLAMLAAGWGAYMLGLHSYVWGLELMLAVGVFVVPMMRSEAYKSVEIAATITLAYHAWVAVIKHFMG